MSRLLHIFPTLSCNGKCDFCAIVPGRGSVRTGTVIPPAAWVSSLVRQECDALYITGGEPMLYPGVEKIVNSVSCPVWFYTNGTVPMGEFLESVIFPERLSVRLSFHPHLGLEPLIGTYRLLRKKRVRVSVHMVDTGRHVEWWRNELRRLGIVAHMDPDFRKFPRAERRRDVRCSVPNVVVGPDGWIYPCTSKLVRGVDKVKRLSDGKFRMGSWYSCGEPDACAPCDQAFSRMLP